MKIGVVGCGLIGWKRTSVLDKEHPVVIVADVHKEKAEKLANHLGSAQATDDWRDVTTHPGVDAVFVATTHDFLAPVTFSAVQSGKHVLVEKPAARNAGELRPVVEEAKKRKITVKTGFNHRFHPGMQKAKEIIDSGVLGPLLFIRARYGHGGRPGYDREWRANPEISGGGELLDQGMHLIDLSRWFLGELSTAGGSVHTYFWNMPVDDNAFMLLKSPANQVAWLHVSWTEWKNTFSFEIYGRDGKLHIEGLGGSYGVERLYYYKMLPEMGPPETVIYEYPGKDLSWELEFKDFCDAIATGRQPCGNLDDALAALTIVGDLYKGKCV
ncbi:MAG: Gfo/Idh/MocA family oxidoreductase [Elusimicrobia bacterium]|nr:Gfo/Idh/MocA family oxidoreductase [Candidatus Obscuribacterium magneticum]